MSNPLLTTKLYFPPTRTSLVPRPRLVERIRTGLLGPLTLISAPAGSGKTTVISQWRLGPGAGVPTAWLSIDLADNDLVRFLQYLSSALDHLQPGLAEETRLLLQSSEQLSWEAILTNIINRLSELEGESVLVLDDYHLVENPTIHTALTFLLDHLPPCLHIILLTRADPPLPLSRLRARDQLTEIRGADLRFTVDESTQFLNQVMSLGLTGEQVAALERRTEGWAAGLQLAALSMRGREDVQGFVSAFTGSNHYIVDYLTEEVLGRQPETLRQFLMKTSILERFTGSLCDALTGEEKGEEILEELDHANLFLIPLDDDRCWYRYHHLFADLLRVRLERSLPGLVSDLHRRASVWFEEQKLLLEAVSHALVGGDADRAARLVEQNVLVMIAHGQLVTLLEWLDALPNEVVRSHPWLSIARAWALAYTAAYDDATKCLVDAAQALEEDADHVLSLDEADHIQGHIYAIRCYMLGISNKEPDQTLELARKALDLLPASDGRARGLVSVMLSVSYRQTMNFAAARESLARALEIARAAGQKYVIIDLLCQTALVDRDQGRFRQAEATCRDALQMVDEFGSNPPVISYAFCTLSEISYEWNDLTAASDYAHKALEIGRQWGSTDLVHGALYAVAMPLIVLRDFDRVLEIIQEMKQLYIPSGQYPRFPVAVEAYARLQMGDAAAAAQCTADLLPHTSEKWRMESLMPVYIKLFRQGLRPSVDDVLDFITHFLPLCESADSPGGSVNALNCRAMALEALGKMEEACADLRQALSMAEPEGYVRLFIDHGTSMEALLSSVRETDQKLRDKTARRRADYAGRLLAALRAEIPSRKPSAPSSPALVEQLSPREIEVLRFLAQGCSDKEIAESLVIARETVHKHLKNIYGKLDVHSRTEAIARARELGLL